MAIRKQGLAYYSIDTDRYQDIRIKKLKKAFGTNGIAIYDFILCEVYRVKGCFLVWDDSTVFDVADYFNLKESLIKEVVNYCAGVGLFHKGLLDRESIITSHSIQIRYLDACIRSKRKSVDIPDKYTITPEYSRQNPEECQNNQEESTQSKVKKSKVKESKEYPPENDDSTFDPKNQKEKKYSSPGAEILYSIEHCITVAMMHDRWVKDSKATPELLSEFNAFLSGQGIYEKNPADYKQHFFNWKQKQSNGNQNGTVKQNNSHKPTLTGTSTGAGKI